MFFYSFITIMYKVQNWRKVQSFSIEKIAKQRKLIALKICIYFATTLGKQIPADQQLIPNFLQSYR